MNKFVKRGCTVLLALTLALGMSVSAFAADTTDAAVQKIYRAANSGTTSPAETFTFKVEKVSVTDGTKADGSPLTEADMPELTISNADYNEGAASDTAVKNLTITPKTNFPNVGVYTYKVTEVAGDTAGVTYDNREMELKATVHYADGKLVVDYAFRPDGASGTKGKDIENTYSAGALTVGKKVTGNLGDKNMKFDIDVTFTAPAGKTVKSTITLSDGTKILPGEWQKNGTVTTVTKTISLKDNTSVKFENVPYDVTYTVKEHDYKDYKVSYEGETGKINASSATAGVINNKPGSVDTGVILHSAPYILLLAGVGAAAVAFLILRKHREV